MIDKLKALARAAPTRENLTPRKIKWIMRTLGTGMMLFALDQTVTATALPRIVGDLHGFQTQKWVPVAYVLVATIVVPVYGKLADHYGAKWLFIGAIGIFLCGSFVCAAAPDMAVLIIGRAVQGVGGGGLMVLTQASVADVVDEPRQRGRYMGPLMIIYSVSMAIGPLIGGVVTEKYGWRWVFWINMPIGLVAMLLALIFLPQGKDVHEKPRFDRNGFLLLSVVSTCVVLVTTWGGSQYSWKSSLIIGLIALAGVGVAMFYFVERGAGTMALMPGSLFKKRDFNLTIVASLIVGFIMLGTMSYLPTYMQMATGDSPTISGLRMLPMMAGIMGTARPIGIYFDKSKKEVLHYKWMPVSGMVLVVVGLLLLHSMNSTTPVIGIEAYLFVMGLGLGLNMPVLQTVIQNLFTDNRGAALATNNYFRSIGSAIGAAIFGNWLVSNIGHLLAERLHGMPFAGSAGTDSLTPVMVRALPSDKRDIVVGAFSDALTPIFMMLVLLALVALAAVAFLNAPPLVKSGRYAAAIESLDIGGIELYPLEESNPHEPQRTRMVELDEFDEFDLANRPFYAVSWTADK